MGEANNEGPATAKQGNMMCGGIVIIILLNIATIVAAIVMGMQVQDKVGEVELKVQEIETMVTELETQLAPVISLMENMPSMPGGGSGGDGNGMTAPNGGEGDGTGNSGPSLPGN